MNAKQVFEKSTSRPKWEIFLNALRAGLSVEMDGHEYAWADDRLCFVLKVWSAPYSLSREPDELRYVECDLPLNTIISMCEKHMSEEDEAFLVSSMTITKIKKGKAR